MSDRLHAIALKLDRAEEHLKAIESFLTPFTYAKSVIRREKNLETGLYDLRLVLPQPDAILSTMIGDCLHNLRCSLDYLAHELVLANQHQPTGDTMFPISSTVAGWERHMKRDRLCGIAPRVKTVIQGLQPHTFDNPTAHPLWRLNTLENIDKHRTLTVTSAIATDIVVRFNNFGAMFHEIFPGISVVSSYYENNAVLASSHDPAVLGANVKMEGYSSLLVAFQEPVAKNVDVRSLLRDIHADITGRVIPNLAPFL